jgi:hypothetical protein
MPLSPLSALKLDEWDWMIDVNIRGVLHGIAAVLPRMEAQGHGHIINVSSIGGLVVQPTGAVYSATKFAVRAISEGLRKETDRIRCTCIYPGVVESKLAESISDPAARARMRGYRANAIQPDAIAREKEDLLNALVDHDGTIIGSRVQAGPEMVRVVPVGDHGVAGEIEAVGGDRLPVRQRDGGRAACGHLLGDGDAVLRVEQRGAGDRLVPVRKGDGVRRQARRRGAGGLCDEAARDAANMRRHRFSVIVGGGIEAAELPILPHLVGLVVIAIERDRPEGDLQRNLDMRDEPRPAHLERNVVAADLAALAHDAERERVACRNWRHRRGGAGVAHAVHEATRRHCAEQQRASPHAALSMRTRR